MPNLNMDFAHALAQQEAVQRLKDRFKSIQETYAEHIKDMEEKWDDNALAFGFTTFGLKVQGTVAVEPSEVKLAAKLPLAATMFKGQIQKQIGDELKKLLS